MKEAGQRKHYLAACLACGKLPSEVAPIVEIRRLQETTLAALEVEQPLASAIDPAFRWQELFQPQLLGLLVFHKMFLLGLCAEC